MGVCYSRREASDIRSRFFSSLWTPPWFLSTQASQLCHKSLRVGTATFTSNFLNWTFVWRLHVLTASSRVPCCYWGSFNRQAHQTHCHSSQSNCGPTSLVTHSSSGSGTSHARQEFNHMLELGIIRLSSSNWSSPLHIVPKKSPGDWRPWSDYTSSQPCYSSWLLSSSSLIGLHCHVTRVYHLFPYRFSENLSQIPVEPADIHKTAIMTPFGLFKIMRMLFGLRNAAQTFQWFISEVLHDLPFAYVYVNDLLIASHLPEEHLQHLCSVL